MDAVADEADYDMVKRFAEVFAKTRHALEDGVPAPVRLWQERVHVPGVYDLEVDTEAISAVECVEAIEAMVAEGRPEAFRRLAE